MVFDAAGNPVSVQPFATDVPNPVGLVLGPDGMLYYLSFNYRPDPPDPLQRSLRRGQRHTRPVGPHR